MHVLDDSKHIKQLDASNVLGSLELLAKQIEQAWQETSQLNLPSEYKNIKQVVINGMGGSGLGTHIIQSLYFQKLKVPLGNIHSYSLPGMLDNETLYILSSYSGNTEEVLSTYEPAKRKGAKILAISAGGKLGDLIQQGYIPGYLFKPRYNPSGQPRLGLGYLLVGILGLLRKSGVLPINPSHIKSAVALLSKLKSEFGQASPLRDNPAKQIAEHLKDRLPTVVAADFLAGNAHTFANQLNENAKTFASYFILSELNHHLLEGLSFPKSNPKNLIFIFFDSGLYHQRNQERLKITQDVLKKNKISYLNYRLQGHTQLEQSWAMLLLGSYISFYLAILYGVNPADIPWVDYFKAQLE